MPHNNTQQASQEATYMLPQDVNVQENFQFVSNGITFNYISAQRRVFRDGAAVSNVPWDEAMRRVNAGFWKVLRPEPKQPESTQEALFGFMFQFHTNETDIVCTYVKLPEGNPLITWAGITSTRYSEQECREKIKSGEWIVIPSQKPSDSYDEDSFTHAEQIVSKALAPTGEGVVEDSESFLTQAEVEALCGPAPSECATEEELEQYYASERYMIKQGELMTVIKDACKATNGRLSVHTTQDGYEVYHPWFVDNVKVVDEDVLERLLRVIVLVEGEGGF